MRNLLCAGVIADIQHADCDDGFNFDKTRRRYYRATLGATRLAARAWVDSGVKLILQLGDIIDGKNGPTRGPFALEKVRVVYSTITMDVTFG